MDVGQHGLGLSDESRCRIPLRKHVTPASLPPLEQVTSVRQPGRGRWQRQVEGRRGSWSYAVEEDEHSHPIHVQSRPHTRQLAHTDEAGGAIANWIHQYGAGKSIQLRSISIETRITLQLLLRNI